MSRSHWPAASPLRSGRLRSWAWFGPMRPGASGSRACTLLTSCGRSRSSQSSSATRIAASGCSLAFWCPAPSCCSCPGDRSCSLIFPGEDANESRGAPVMIGIPVKDSNSQSAMFTLCAFGLAEAAIQAWHKAQRHLAWLLVALAVLFLVNILYAAVSRTALVAVPILLVLFAFRRLGWKGVAGLLIATTAIVVAAWATSSHLRERTTGLFEEIRDFEPTALVRTSAGERLEFWRKSVAIIAAAPVFGHGTGTIAEQFRRSAVRQTGIAAQASTNPHNQIFATAIQLGLVGVLLLFAMWTAHLRFLGGPGVAPGLGLVVVVQNIVSSLFNSSLFDFGQGWIYVLGVGTLCGMVLHDQRRAAGRPRRKT